MPEFTEFPIPRKDVADTTEGQKAAIRTALGAAAAADLTDVDNTSDADKPVSTAQQEALNDKQDILNEGAFVDGDKTKLDNQSGVNTGDESTATATTEGTVKASEFGKQLITQPSKRLAQDMLSVPLPYAAFNLISSQAIWRKAAKFTSTKAIAISVTVRSSTGYVRIMNHDGTLEAVDGTGAAGSNITVASKAPPSDRAPRFYAIYPCDVSGNLSGDLTILTLSNNQLTSFDGTGLGAVTNLTLSGNQLTSFDGTGLSAVTALGLSGNQLTSFDGTGLSALTTLNITNNQLTSFDGTELGSLAYLNLTNNQLTSFYGTGLGSLAYLNLTNNQLTSFYGTGLGAVTDLYLNTNQLTSFDGTGLDAVTVLDLSSNQLTSVRAVGLTTDYGYGSYYLGFNLNNNLLDAAALNQFYTDLADGTGWIGVENNPGTAGDDTTIATNKGYSIYGSE